MTPGAPTVAIQLLLLAACSSNGQRPSVVEPAVEAAESLPAQTQRAVLTQIELRLDEATTVAAGGFELTWVELRDSRCPLGTQCIWEGEVKVSLEIRTSRGEERHRLDLFLPPQGRGGEAERDVARVDTWRLRLLSVDPPPRNGVATQRSDYLLWLEVTPTAASP